MTKKLYAGVDIGSTTTKAVLIDEDENILGYVITGTMYDRNASGEQALNMVISQTNVSREQVKTVCATGYGRRAFEAADVNYPEILCHGCGTIRLHPQTRTIIDIGGQDSKIIAVNENGKVTKFEMNDKCAAGTGRFFEVLSNRLLNVSIDDIDRLAVNSENPAQISSTCTVFAESEVVSLLSQGVPVEDIAMGMLEAISRRIFFMGRQSMMNFEQDIVLTGGLARNAALKKAFEMRMETEVKTIENPQLPAALGAAILAKNNAQKEKEDVN